MRNALSVLLSVSLVLGAGTLQSSAAELPLDRVINSDSGIDWYIAEEYWYVQDEVTHNGNGALRPRTDGSVGGVLLAELDGPGTISFWCRVDEGTLAYINLNKRVAEGSGNWCSVADVFSDGCRVENEDYAECVDCGEVEYVGYRARAERDGSWVKITVDLFAQAVYDLHFGSTCYNGEGAIYLEDFV